MITNRYEQASKIYARIGVDTLSALEKMKDIRISVHCWQSDDVTGFEGGRTLSGGIAATGNYPFKAANASELFSDLSVALNLIPGHHRLNLHAMYAITDEPIERDKLLPAYFDKWIDFAKENGLYLDFNPTLFSHEKVVDGLTLSSPIKEVRDFWINHCKATRRISEYIGKALGSPCLHNIWIPDGLKDIPGDRMAPRKRLKESLDEIFTEKLDPRYITDSVESKVFGIGLESYTVGSHEFYLNYDNQNNVLCLIDNGHFHPTENVADKLSSMLLFHDKIALHVTRPVRWDSDHVILFNDELRDIATEIVRCGLDRALIGLDYFDASINRVAALVIGTRNILKAFLYALLLPNETLGKLQDDGNFTELMALNELTKTMPFGDIWDYYCQQSNTAAEGEWLDIVKAYEHDVLSKRG